MKIAAISLTTCIAICLALAAATPRPATAQPVVRLDVEGGAKYIAGDNTMEIGGKVVRADGSRTTVGFPVSRLEFPVDAFTATAKARADYGSRWSFILEGGRSITDTERKMKDSDWIYGDFGNPGSRDSYSESSVDMDVWLLDTRVRYKIAEMRHGAGMQATERLISFTKYSFFASMGFMFQDYTYEVSEVTQYSLSNPGQTPVFDSGVGLEYNLTYYVPYTELGFGINHKDRFHLEASIGGTLFAHAEDKAEHVRRGVISKMDSNWDGDMLMGNATARYNFTDNIYCTLSLEGRRIFVEDKSVTYEPGSQVHTIEEELTGRNSSVSTSFGYRF
ncbi:MAG: hypothetical protein ACLFOY_16735 [Desulfatibacillaceae bacterium]